MVDGFGLNFPMEKASSRSQEVRFAGFAVDLQAGELRKHRVKIRLQEEPFQMLSVSLERPDEVVTREELQKRLWSGNTFVDFEHSLATAVKKLRNAGPAAQES
jgi:DNA-binding response OmpR family regulator